ncbi:MAG TPA: hypothetical protein VME63_03200 [Dyella sp.]|uniref:hypothetical protein n=1 Tax=Dyella sp. TaxID=1869338 RepID=UPI002BCCA107|nr:hypothetical protein [Dyella sp.]HTV84382.1 hypothetical protein [Dyella sp.]
MTKQVISTTSFALAVAASLFMPLAGAVDYPNNVPTKTVGQINVEESFKVLLSPHQRVEVRGSFTGSATGCVIYVHDITQNTPVNTIVHHLNANPEQVNQQLSAGEGPATYLISAFQFIGGPPHVPGPPGYSQVGLSNGSTSPIPGRAVFTCNGSTHGSTGVDLQIAPG